MYCFDIEKIVRSLQNTNLPGYLIDIIIDYYWIDNVRRLESKRIKTKCIKCNSNAFVTEISMVFCPNCNSYEKESFDFKSSTEIKDFNADKTCNYFQIDNPIEEDIPETYDELLKERSQFSFASGPVDFLKAIPTRPTSISYISKTNS